MGVKKLIRNTVETAYVPVLSDDTGTNLNEAFFQLLDGGRRMRIEGLVRWNNSGDDAGAFTIDLPGGWEFDGARIAGLIDDSANAAAALIGTCRWFDSGVSWKHGSCEAGDTNKVKFIIGSVLTGNVFAANDGLVFNIDVPVKRSAA